MDTASAAVLGYVVYDLRHKGAKTLAKLDVVRCGNVLFHKTLHARGTLSDRNGVQGVSVPPTPLPTTV